MKKILALIISIVSIINLALPLTVAAEAGTANYIIDKNDFSNGLGNWSITGTEGVTHGITTDAIKDNPCYMISTPPGASSKLTFTGKKDTFEHGEVTIEAKFMQNTYSGTYDLCAITDTTGKTFVPATLFHEAINGKAVPIWTWFTLTHVMNIEEKYYRTYIRGGNYANDTLVASGNNVVDMTNFDSLSFTFAPTGTTTSLFWLDDIVIKQTQNNTNVTRAEIKSAEFYTVTGSLGVGVTDITEDVFYATIKLSKPISAVPLRHNAVKATINGTPAGVHAYGANKTTVYYGNGRDYDYVDTFNVYFDEMPPTGSVVQIDLRNLYDEDNMKVKENCVIQATVEGTAQQDIELMLVKENGMQVLSATQLAVGERVKAQAKLTAVSSLVGKDAILALAAFDGNKMLDIVSTDVTIPEGDGVLNSDYLEVTNSDAEDYAIKQFFILKQNVSPVVDVGVVTGTSVSSTVKPEMMTSFDAFDKVTDTGYVPPYDAIKIDYEPAKKYFTDTVCFVVDSNYFWGRDSKYKAPDKVLWVEEDLYVSVDMMNNIFGYKSYPFARELNGKQYVSLKRAADEVLDLYADISDHGFAVVSNRKFYLADEVAIFTVDTMMRYIISEFPTVSTIMAGISGRQHPYLIGTQSEFDAIKAKITAGHRVLKDISDELISRARADLINPSYSMVEGSSSYYGMEANDVLEYFWAWHMTGDDAFAQKCIADAVTMAGWTQYSGSGADSFFLETERVLGALAYTLDLFYDELTSSQKSKIISAIVSKCLTYAERRYNNGDWAIRTNNWNTTCNSGVILGALAVGDDYTSDTSKTGKVIAAAIQSLQFQSLHYGPNGGWVEGPSYFVMTVNKYVQALTALNKIYGHDFSLSAVPGLLNSGNQAAYLSSRAGVFALCETSPNIITIDSNLAPFAAYKLNDINIQRIRHQMAAVSSGSYNIMDLIWYMEDSENKYTLDMPLDMNYSFSELASSRDNWDDNATFLAVHAGANNNAHAHYDAGSFVFHSQGVEFAKDMGSGSYEIPAYHGENAGRNAFYVARAEGHNLFVVNPDKTPGQLFTCETEVETVEAKPNGAIYKIDLTYPYVGQVRKAERGFMLTEGRKVLYVQDEIVPKSQSDEIYWFWHVGKSINNNGTITFDTKIEKLDDKHVRLTREKKTLDLYFESNVDFELSYGETTPLPLSPKPDLKISSTVTAESQFPDGPAQKITAKFNTEAEKVIFRVIAVPGNMRYTRPTTLREMSTWRIEDGIRSDKYTIANGEVSNVKYGTSVEEFLSNVFVEEFKKVVKNGTEVTKGIITEGMQLVADGDTYDIVPVSSGACIAYPIIGYTESDTIEQMVAELGIVLGEDVRPSITKGNVIDGMKVTSGNRTYTVTTSNSYVLNMITGLREDTPTALMLYDLRDVLPNATAEEGDYVFDGMKVTAENGKVYTVRVDAPINEVTFNNLSGEFTTGQGNTATRNPDGLDVIYNPQKTTLSYENSDLGNKAFHIVTDGTSSSASGIQFCEYDDEGITGKIKIEFKYKAADISTEFVMNGGTGTAAQGYPSQYLFYFKNGGRIVYGDPSNSNNYVKAGYWEPNKWYHIEIEMDAGNSSLYSLRINGELVAEGHDANLLSSLTRVQTIISIQPNVQESVWFDDFRVTRVY